MLTYGNHLWSAVGSAFRLGTDPQDRWLLCMPLYHVGGMAIVLRCCLYGTTVILQERFDPVAVNQALDTQGVTLVSLVPTMLHRLLEARGERPLPATLRCILVGGAAAPPSLLEKCLALGWPLATTYGLTEAASQVATATPAQVRRKPGTAGKPLMFTQVRIVGEDGEELPPGEIGEIVVSGPTVMRGYYSAQRSAGGAQRAAVSDQRSVIGHPLHTGDLGYLDEEGDLWVVQRRADLIVTGGENVYPAEVEGVLLAHPGVEEACVVGIADPEWGQRVAAAVVVRPGARLTEEELIAFCRQRLAGYKQPRLLRFVKGLPRTASGKVDRAAVVREVGASKARAFG
jgi:O-succinylbenzoic acid--CoA ligase